MKAGKRFSFIISLSLLFLLLCTAAKADDAVAFCGIVSKDAEGSMVKMTEDLYYTQLGSIDGIKVVDRRKSGFANAYVQAAAGSVAQDAALRLAAAIAEHKDLAESRVFYALITKMQDDKWALSLCMATTRDKTIRTVDKTYDSYYKILMENKNVLLASFKTLLNGGGDAARGEQIGVAQTDGLDGNSSQGTANDGGVKGSEAALRPSRGGGTDSLSGTWIGEEGVDKAVILRGGRGFIIFRNGATMNIKVETQGGGESVVITQAGKSNASFFPELPRQVALNSAASAEPIVWTLSLTGDDTLTGKKRTLVENGKGASMSYVEVTWRRK